MILSIARLYPLCVSIAHFNPSAKYAAEKMKPPIAGGRNAQNSVPEFIRCMKPKPSDEITTAPRSGSLRLNRSSTMPLYIHSSNIGSTAIRKKSRGMEMDAVATTGCSSGTTSWLPVIRTVISVTKEIASKAIMIKRNEANPSICQSVLVIRLAALHARRGLSKANASR